MLSCYHFHVDNKYSEVHRRAVSLAQSTISMTLTERQVTNKKSEVIRAGKEMPQQLAIGLAIHQAIRSKEIVNFLYAFGMSVEYNRILRVEAQIEKHVVQRMERSGGIYVPPHVVPSSHVFFAVDNVDFGIDTPDGKRVTYMEQRWQSIRGKTMKTVHRSSGNFQFSKCL